jgi:hypothetical protein
MGQASQDKLQTEKIMTPTQHTLSQPTFLAFGREQIPMHEGVKHLTELEINQRSGKILLEAFKCMLNGQPTYGVSNGDWEFFLRTIHQHEGEWPLQMALASLRALLESGKADKLPGLWDVWLTFEELAKSMH